MATGHSILDTLNATSKGATPTGPSGKFRTKDLPIAQLYRNEGNFYAIVEIEELAGMILATGLLENLAVVYDPTDAGQYRIVSGERRWEALKLLVSRGHQEFATVTCNVRAKRTAEEETIDLIAANSQRVKSIDDQLQEYTTLKATLEHMRETGQHLDGYDLESGRLRDVIAQILNKSTTKIAQIERITTHLIPELRELLNTGSLRFSAAYDMSRLDEDAQRDAYDRAQELGQEITGQTAAKAVREQKQERDTNPWASSSCERVNGSCDHWPVIKANFMHRGNLIDCAGCCEHCNAADTCEFCCEVVAARRPAPVQAQTVPAWQEEPATPAAEEEIEDSDSCYDCPHRQECSVGHLPDGIQCPETYRNANLVPDEEPMGTFADEDLDEDFLADLIKGCVENAGMSEQLTTAALNHLEDLVEVWRKNAQIKDGIVLELDKILTRFGCVDENGIVQDTTGPGEKYSPGEIMDVLEEMAERNSVK